MGEGAGEVAQQQNSLQLEDDGTFPKLVEEKTREELPLVPLTPAKNGNALADNLAAKWRPCACRPCTTWRRHIQERTSIQAVGAGHGLGLLWAYHVVLWQARRAQDMHVLVMVCTRAVNVTYHVP